MAAGTARTEVPRVVPLGAAAPDVGAGVPELLHAKAATKVATEAPMVTSKTKEAKADLAMRLCVLSFIRCCVPSKEC